MKCPICEGAGSLPDVGINLRYNTVSHNGNSVILPGREAEILYVIIHEGPVTIDKIISKVFKISEAEDPYNGVQVSIYKLRKRLRLIGLSILNIRPKGFSSKASYIVVEIKK